MRVSFLFKMKYGDAMPREDVIVRFEEESFEYGHKRPIVKDVSFSLRGGSKSTLMALITGALKPESGTIHITEGLTIATARQVISREQADLSVRAFFEKSFAQKVYDIDPRIDAALEVVHLAAPKDKIIKSFSGGQQIG